MNNFEEQLTLKIKPRPSEIVTISIPIDTLENLKKIADSKNISVESLIKLYIGQNLREEISKNFASKLLDSTVEILTKHIQSKAELLDILQEIQAKTRV